MAALRIVVGFHFFDQGHQKYRQGGFDSTGFLKYAKGPFAPLFHSMVPDYDGKIRLCYDPDQKGVNKINSQKTLAIWQTYKNFVVDELIKEEERLVERRERTRERIAKLSPDSEEYLVENTLYQRDEKTILAIRHQLSQLFSAGLMVALGPCSWQRAYKGSTRVSQKGLQRFYKDFTNVSQLF